MTSIPKNDACRICGKPLTDPLSVAVGFGPVCRITAKMRTIGDRQQDLFGHERATYTRETRGDVILITDLNKGRTVTNDAESVIGDLVECLGDLAGKRIVYRDTSGVWDELVVTSNRFTGFRSVGVRTPEEVLAKIAREVARAPARSSSTLSEFLAGGASSMDEVLQVDTDWSGRVLEVRFPNA
ncbi:MULTISPECIES: DUF6011 domain-containing protein [unclassified Methylobacterium]|uniref:DUF6011 domain-containing protein n=1 Tax=unclassified Methylobacterium TaxID=2615210 RepID=UPI0011C1E29A|nr:MULTISPECIES: DUF6011 domain-containing protein [unclassified Methylobacterium]QEE39817.1 hypothetical protein FVA80_13510 [Methylobacterium sp. WL1]TXN57339.1 hypothetical protein FV241_11800 [Methylobacterium sp. WL2]